MTTAIRPCYLLSIYCDGDFIYPQGDMIASLSGVVEIVRSLTDIARGRITPVAHCGSARMEATEKIGRKR